MIPGPASSVDSVTKANGKNRAHDAQNNGNKVRIGKFLEILRRPRREYYADSRIQASQMKQTCKGPLADLPQPSLEAPPSHGPKLLAGAVLPLASFASTALA